MSFAEITLIYKGKEYKAGIELSGELEHENEDIQKIHLLINSVQRTLIYLISGREANKEMNEN
jgi:hypothetical protein